MLRSTCFFRAPAASGMIELPPTSLKSALQHRRVLRLLGGPFGTAGGNESSRLAKVFTDILESTKKSGAVEHGNALAYAGRAAALLNCGCLENASEDLAVAKTTPQLRGICASIGVKIAQAKLSHAVRVATVSGSETDLNPSHLSNLQSELNSSIEELRGAASSSSSENNNNNNDFVPHLLAAEARLSGIEAADPVLIGAEFDKIKEEMFRPSLLSFGCGNNNDNTETTPQYATIAFDAQRAFSAQQVLASSFSSSSLKAGLGAPDKSNSLSLEENAALMQAAAWLEESSNTESCCSSTSINVLDMGDAATAGYGPGRNAVPLLVEVGHFLGLISAHNAVTPRLSANLASITERGTHDVSPIEEALKNKNEDILAQLSGSTSSSRLSLADDGFSSILENLSHGYSHGGSSTCDYSNLDSPTAFTQMCELESVLLRQAHSRARVGMAAGLALANQLGKADALLNEVISENSYVELWRALLLKGNVAKKLGQVEQSDAAFRALHQLKMQPQGRDLPLRDKHRDLSQF